MSYSKYTMHKLHFGTDLMYRPPKLSEIWSIYCFPMPPLFLTCCHGNVSSASLGVFKSNKFDMIIIFLDCRTHWCIVLLEYTIIVVSTVFESGQL